MEMHRDNTSPIKIQSVTSGEITVNHQKYTSSIQLSLHNPPIPWRPTCADDITADDLVQLTITSPEIILIGTGDKHLQLSPKILQSLYQYKIGFEIMSTIAACRTFTLLASDQRNILAAVII
jgi:uncharacterized protein